MSLSEVALLSLRTDLTKPQLPVWFLCSSESKTFPLLYQFLGLAPAPKENTELFLAAPD